MSCSVRRSRSGSATPVRTKKNSRGACNQDVASNPVTALRPFRLTTTVRVPPKLKKPSTPAVNNENAISKRLLTVPVIGGVQCTLPIMNGYTNESMTGMQLFKKTSSISDTWPKADAARTGPMTREVIKSNRNARNVDDVSVPSAPAREPRAKATRVAPNAISMSFMGEPSNSLLLGLGVK